MAHPDNPINNLSIHDVRKIFQGEYNRWSELHKKYGAISNGSIQAVVRLHYKKRAGHWRELLKSENLFSPRIYEVGVIPDMIRQVAINPFAIGYETVYMLEIHNKNGTLKTLKINGINARDLHQAERGVYPLYRTYNLTSWQSDSSKNKFAMKLIRAIETYIEQQGTKFGIIPSKQLRKLVWKFNALNNCSESLST